MITISDWDDLSSSELRARLINRGHTEALVDSLIRDRDNPQAKLQINRLMNSRGTRETG